MSVSKNIFAPDDKNALQRLLKQVSAAGPCNCYGKLCGLLRELHQAGEKKRSAGFYGRIHHAVPAPAGHAG